MADATKLFDGSIDAAQKRDVIAGLTSLSENVAACMLTHTVTNAQQVAGRVDLVLPYGANATGPVVIQCRRAGVNLAAVDVTVSYPVVGTLRLANTGGGAYVITQNDVLHVIAMP